MADLFRLRPLMPPLHSMTVYETAAVLYIVGCCSKRKRWKLLCVDRRTAGAEAEEIKLTADPAVYSAAEMKGKIAALRADHGYLKTSLNAKAIAGFCRLLDGWYGLFIIESHSIGVIGGSSVFVIDKTAVLPLHNKKPGAASKDEARYKSIFMSLDLTKDCFYSLSYDLTNTLQENMSCMRNDGKQLCNDMVVWNAHLLSSMTELGPDWVLPIIHGFFEQRKLQWGHTSVRMTLIARRSRHFAGTRFLRRGVNWRGWVANEVETETIVCDADDGIHGQGVFTSCVQVRGSIPLFWTHKNLASPKPDVVMSACDPDLHATRTHFARLNRRYGMVVCLNLIRQQHPKESRLFDAFTNAIARINADAVGNAESSDGEGKSERTNPVGYISFDFLRCSKSKAQNTNVIDHVSEITSMVQTKTGIFRTTRPVSRGDRKSGWTVGVGGTRQSGILRSNCVDCLDRTNVAQFSFSRAALRSQLAAIGISQELIESNFDDVWTHLMQMFAQHGDEMALQYGGSGAMHRIALVKDKAKDSAPKDGVGESDKGPAQAGIAGGVQNAFVATKRYYANNISDPVKQQGLDLLLGVYRPAAGNRRHIWQIEGLSQMNEGAPAKDADGQVMDADASPPVNVWREVATVASHRQVCASYFEEKYQPSKMTSFEELNKLNTSVTVGKGDSNHGSVSSTPKTSTLPPPHVTTTKERYGENQQPNNANALFTSEPTTRQQYEAYVAGLLTFGPSSPVLEGGVEKHSVEAASRGGFVPPSSDCCGSDNASTCGSVDQGDSRQGDAQKTPDVADSSVLAPQREMTSSSSIGSTQSWLGASGDMAAPDTDSLRGGTAKKSGGVWGRIGKMFGRSAGGAGGGAVSAETANSEAMARLSDTLSQKSSLSTNSLFQCSLLDMEAADAALEEGEMDDDLKAATAERLSYLEDLCARQEKAVAALEDMVRAKQKGEPKSPSV